MAAHEDGPAPARSIEAVPPPAVEDPTWARLEDQLGWYDRKSRDNQRRYKWLKLLELAIAAALPVVAAVGSPVWVTGGLAAVIVLLEGAQHLYQFQEHWITYRSTAEALKHERYFTWPRRVLTVARTATVSLPSGSKGLSPRNMPNGPPAIQILAPARLIDSATCSTRGVGRSAIANRVILMGPS